MRKFAIYALLAGLLGLPMSVASAAQSGGLKPIQTPPAQTPTPLGFSTVLCVADGVSGASLPGTIVLGKATITSTSGVYSPSTGLSAINVTITNGTLTSGEYVITFVDNGDNTLNCGDTIVSVVPLS